MFKERKALFELILACFDLAFVSAAWFFTYWFRFYSNLFSVPKGVPSLDLYLSYVWVVLIVWFLCFKYLGLYKSHRSSSFELEAWKLLKANFLAIIVLLALTYLSKQSEPFSRLAFGWFGFFSFVFTALGRFSLRVLLKELRRRGFNLKYCLLVGESEAARGLLRSLKLYKEAGFQPVGILVTDKFEGDQFESVPVIGKLSDLIDVIARYKIDTVFLTLPLSEMPNLNLIVDLLSNTHVDVKLVPDLGSLITVGGTIEDFDGLPIISLQESPLQGPDYILKRLLDVSLSLAALVALSPLFIVLAALVKLTSKGSIFYCQERVTLDGRRFKIYKFRTMVETAEASGPQWPTKNDPRVTPIGRFLRKWSLDELPQLFNVLKGDMSLVGPRPERPYFIKQFWQKIPSYMLRHKVPAGLTGLAQVHGLRGDTSLEERLKYDLFYIKNWSLFLDIKIIFLTIIKGLKNRNI